MAIGSSPFAPESRLETVAIHRSAGGGGGLELGMTPILGVGQTPSMAEPHDQSTPPPAPPSRPGAGRRRRGQTTARDLDRCAGLFAPTTDVTHPRPVPAADGSGAGPGSVVPFRRRSE
jgi:hypothetical protein